MATGLDSSPLTRDEPQIPREGEASSVFIKGRQAALVGGQYIHPTETIQAVYDLGIK